MFHDFLQFHYGSDSLDVTKTSFLMEFDFLADNMQILVESYDLEKVIVSYQLHSFTQF